MKDHDEPLGEISFVPYFEDINVESDPGTTTSVTLHNGTKVLLTKLAEDYHPTDKMSALRLLHETAGRGEYATGILYVEPTSRTSSSCSASSTSRWRSSISRGPGRARPRWTRSWRASAYPAGRTHDSKHLRGATGGPPPRRRRLKRQRPGSPRTDGADSADAMVLAW